MLVLLIVCIKAQANPSLNSKHHLTPSRPIQIIYPDEAGAFGVGIKRSAFLHETHDPNHIQPLREGQTSQWKKGALIGAAVGTPLTFLVLHSGGSSSICNRSANQDAVQFHECLAMSLGGGVVFAGMGALIGSFVKHRVSTNELRNRVNITLFSPNKNGIGVAVAVRLV
ncbi:MAG: hypothetical protein RIG77_23925 [Cyclobacteriaceae bacterium]